MQSPRQIAIVGAGIGGLNAAPSCGRPVAISPSTNAPHPRGRTQLLEREGARIDVGTEYFTPTTWKP